MQRLRTIALIMSLAAFAWLLFNKAGEREISDALWVNLAYAISLIAVATVAVVFSVSAIRRRFHPSLAITAAIAIIVIMAFAATDVFCYASFSPTYCLDFLFKQFGQTHHNLTMSMS